MAVFLDTGFYMGLCHPKDSHAEDSLRIFRLLSSGEFGVLYTSLFIINEVTTLAAIRTKSNIEILQHLGNFLWGQDKIAVILPFTEILEMETWELFIKINSKGTKQKRTMSFTDISSIILSKHHQIDKIVSYDPHFDGFLERVY